MHDLKMQDMKMHDMNFCLGGPIHTTHFHHYFSVKPQQSGGYPVHQSFLIGFVKISQVTLFAAGGPKP